MKRLIMPLIALTFLVGACSSPTQATKKPSRPPVQTGTKPTAWGELPTYDGSGQTFVFAQRPQTPGGAFTLKTVEVDVMVNADGTVEDATVRQSSGDPAIDKTALASFIGARYSLQLGPDNPTPYVVALTMQFTKEADYPIASIAPYSGIGRQDSQPAPTAPYNQAWSGANGGWSGGGGYSSSSSSK